MWFSSATLVVTSSPVAALLLRAKFEVFVASPNGLTSASSFSFADFFHGRPLLAPGPEGFRAPFARTGVLGSDKVDDDLPVDAFAASTLLFLLVCHGM